MKIALASPPFPESMSNGIEWIEKFIKKSSSTDAEIVCFPEAYLPGMRGTGLFIGDVSSKELMEARDKVCFFAEKYNINVILPMEWRCGRRLQNVAFVISQEGKVLGVQTKNQLDPSEDNIYVPGNERNIFEVNGIKFGISICHEGFRYPESVRWAAINGACIVFHPHFAGTLKNGEILSEWGNANNPYYEKAMICRAIENNIFFASVNYALKYQDSATTIISPDGKCINWLPYGDIDILTADIDISRATRKLAVRYKKDLYK